MKTFIVPLDIQVEINKVQQNITDKERDLQLEILSKFLKEKVIHNTK